MKKLIALGALAVSANAVGLCLAAVEFDSPARISGVTDKDPLTYALGEGVTSLYVSVPWSCDFGRTEMGRNHGPWYVKWTPALGYFDPVYHIKRLSPDCRFSVGRAGLGDYICPPSGVALLYKNAAAKQKSISWVQGSTHAYVPPKPWQEHRDQQ